MKKRRKARKHKARSPLHSLRGVLASWKEKKAKTSSPPPVVAEPDVEDERRAPKLASVIPSNLCEKWHELKSEKEKCDKSTPEESRYSSFIRKHRRAILGGVCCLVALGAIISTAQYLRHISQQKEADLVAAVKSEDWGAVHQKLALTNVSVFHFFNPHLQYSVSLAESWIQRQKIVHEALNKRLTAIESGKATLESLSIHAVAEIERALRSLPADINNLSARWSMLHAKNRELFSKNRNYVMEQLLSQQEISTFLTLNETEDIAILKAKIDEWDDFLEACHAYDVPPHLKAKCEQYLENLRQYHAEALALQGFKEHIQEAVTYSELITQSRKRKATKYEPARKLFGLFQTLPTREEWAAKMCPINKLLPEGKCDSAKAMLIKGGATYSTAFPVSQELYAQANELFSAPSLHQRFYQVFHADGSFHISEEYPQRQNDEEREVFFALSAMDPAFNTSPTKVVSWDSRSVSVRSVCCAQLMQECKINRESLFLNANFPQILEQIINSKDADCPSLAKAFVFHRILQLLKGHPFYSQHLKQFAPTLAADTAHFEKLRTKHAEVMHSGAWLHPTSQVSAAEKDFSRWFKTLKNREYGEEIANAAAPLFRATPHYIGLADETGKVIPKIQMKEHTVIWFLGEDGIRSSAPGKLPEGARPYSPLFINSNLQ